MMKEEIDSKMMKEVEEQAKKNLEGVIMPNQLGYQGFLEKEILKILKEKGIEWQKPSNSYSED